MQFIKVHCTVDARSQGIIQKKSASSSQMLPCLRIFFRNFILIFILNMPKMVFNRGTLVSPTAVYQMKCPFTVLSGFFLFFQMLPYDSRLFPGSAINVH